MNYSDYPTTIQFINYLTGFVDIFLVIRVAMLFFRILGTSEESEIKTIKIKMKNAIIITIFINSGYIFVRRILKSYFGVF